MKKERKIKFPTKVYSREEGKTKFKAKEKATKLVCSVWEFFFRERKLVQRGLTCVQRGEYKMRGENKEMSLFTTFSPGLSPRK